MSAFSHMPPNPMIEQPASEDLPAAQQASATGEPSGQQQASQPQSVQDAPHESPSN